MKYFITDTNNDPIKIFYNFVLIYFFINLTTSISLSLSVFSIYQGLISIFIVYIFGFFLIFKNKIEKNHKNLFLIIILFSVLFWIFAFYPALNTNDDFRAYLFFIEKSASEGSLSIDPFSSRRMYSLGGLYPFQGSLSSYDLKFLSLIEPALGIFLTSIAILFFNKNTYLKLLCIIILFLSPLLGSKVLANTAGVFTLVFFSYTILSCYSLSIKENENLNNLKLIIIILCLVLSLTIRPIPFVFNFLIISFLFIYFYKFKKSSIKFIPIFIIFILCLIYLYPFLRASYVSSGTLLYPILGDGWRLPSEYSPQRFDNFINITNLNKLKFFLLLPFKDIFFIISISGIFFLIKKKEIFLKISLFISYLTFYLIIVFTVGDDVALVKRYSFTVSFSIILYLISFHIENSYQIFSKKNIFYTSSLFLIFTLIFVWFYKGSDVNDNRKKVSNSFESVSNKEDLSKISYLKDDKILVTSKQVINLYKNNFKNLIIFDVPFQTIPWSKDKINSGQFVYDKKKIIRNFHDHLNQKNIKYIIIDISDAENEIKVNSLLGEFLKTKTIMFKYTNFTLHKINF